MLLVVTKLFVGFRRQPPTNMIEGGFLSFLLFIPARYPALEQYLAIIRLSLLCPNNVLNGEGVNTNGKGCWSSCFGIGLGSGHQSRCRLIGGPD